jgi:hypothetical protein
MVVRQVILGCFLTKTSAANCGSVFYIRTPLSVYLSQPDLLLQTTHFPHFRGVSSAANIPLYLILCGYVLCTTRLSHTLSFVLSPTKHGSLLRLSESPNIQDPVVCCPQQHSTDSKLLKANSASVTTAHTISRKCADTTNTSGPATTSATSLPPTATRLPCSNDLVQSA